ncbi:MAG: DNA-processing protein DprA [Oscillospiraceae bacterium]|nr:DNA-processing protein DprA [Oscillospiraceae bacterium]
MNSSAIYWLWLSSLAEVNLNAKAALLEVYGSAEAAFFAPKGSFTGVEGITARDAEALEARDLTEARLIPERCEEEGLSFLTLDDARYPKRLKEIFAPPVVLYVKGRLPDLDAEVPVAVIGTRKASPYGIKMGRNMAYELSKCGSVIVSGLTQGIDAAAAEGALAAGGICVGVLGTPIKARSGLPARVCRQGALLSEYAPGTPQLKTFFRARNRIAAGISVGVVVAEAPEKSGTRLFVAEALEQGKEIFAIPGNADSETGLGTIRFLREGAQLVTHGWEVAEELNVSYPNILNPESRASFPQFPDPEPMEKKPAFTEKKSGKNRSETSEKRPKQEAASEKSKKKRLDNAPPHCYIDISEKLSVLSETQQQVALAVLSGACSAEEIIGQTGLEAKAVLSALTMLEIRGVTRRDAAGNIIIREE